MTVRVIPWKPGSGRKRWQVDVRGERADGSAFRDRKVIEGPESRARAWGEKRQAVLLGEIHAPAPKPEAKPTVLTVGEWAAVFSERYYMRAKASARDTALGLLATHIVPLIGPVRLDEVRRGVVDDLERRWRAGGYKEANERGREVKPTNSVKSLNNRRQVLASLLAYAVECKEESGLQALPVKVTLAPVDKGKAPRFYELKAFARLAEAARALGDPRALAILYLGADAGLRGGEMLALTWERVNWGASRLTVAESKHERRVGDTVTDAVKGGVEKPVPMSPRLADALRVLQKERKGEHVLVDADGKPLTWRALTWIIQRAERGAGFEERGRVHVLRHTFGSHLSAAGVPARLIMELARHADLSTSQKYMHLAADAKEDGIAALTALRGE